MQLFTIIKRNVPTKIKAILYYYFKICYYHILNIYHFRKPINYKNVPIIINNFNRLTSLKLLIHSLEIRGYYNIYIIDNQSTYPPLLNFYKTCPYHIFKLDKNYGYKAIWETPIYNLFKKSFYVYTDSDMQIDDLCPDNFIEHFLKIMKKYPKSRKVGFGIRIDNLPDHYKFKSNVIKHETQFWNEEIEPNIYKASIDTTFAIYRPYYGEAANYKEETYRTGYPYLIKHLPWYIDSEHLDEEELYYISNINQSTHWSITIKKNLAT